MRKIVIHSCTECPHRYIGYNKVICNILNMRKYSSKKMRLSNSVVTDEFLTRTIPDRCPLPVN